MKTYIGIVRDRSGSIASYGLERPCAKDYNSQLLSIQENTRNLNLTNILSVMDFGNSLKPFVTITPVLSVQPQPVHEFRANLGGTRLFDAIGELITQFKSMPDANDPNVAFLIMAITDGEENASGHWRDRLAGEIRTLQSTDRWTFTFRVPRGYKRALASMGVFPNNIMEWDQTEAGLQVAEVATVGAQAEYFSGRSRGVTASKSFYTTDLSNVNVQTIKANMVDISKDVTEWKVNTDAEAQMQIRVFCEKMSGKPFLKGAAFYELVKKEDEVQDYKQIMILDRATRAVYSGLAARQILQLPTAGTIQLRPGDHAAYDVFIQSTSVNRKLPVGTRVMYWPGVGAPLKAATAAPKKAKAVRKVAKTITPKPAVARTPAVQAAVARAVAGGIASWQLANDYRVGYKDGRGKKKNLANAGTYVGNAQAYLDGFKDGKIKATPKFS